MPIDELFLVPSEDSVDEEGKRMYCVFNRARDSITFIGATDFALLKERGVQVLPALPELG
jgi:hypothetical protein